jgi:hypothetical protein
MAIRKFLVFDLCLRFKRLDWRTQDAERMVTILLRGK